MVHTYTYDSAGRLSADTASNLGSSGIVDGAVRRVGTTYDQIGRARTVTDYSDTAGTQAVNQVQYVYNGWGQVYREYQGHDGLVDANSDGTPDAGVLFVQYDYADGALGGVAKYIRLDEATYPNGREVHYDYGTAGAIDDIMSRLSAIYDDVNDDGDISSGEDVYAAYKYLGAGRIVEEDYVEAQTKLSYLNTAGTNVTGLDRFGRVIDQVWTDYGADPDTVIDYYTYTYDRAGNRLRKSNLLNSALDEDYVYDDADRLVEWKVNNVSRETWSLDSLGNNRSAGTYNAANEETPTQGSSGYDAAGNMTTLQSGKTAKYDAWNRLVQVNNGTAIDERYEYDGTGRRIQIFSNFSGTPATTADVQDDYHVGQQVVESDKTTGYDLSTKTGTAAGGHQTIWSPRYIDSAILRDTLTMNRSGIVAAERVFYLADANYNVTGLVKYDSGASAWHVAERYTYTPYGVVTYRNATTWDDVGSSANANTTLYTGRTLDVLTSLYYYRARFYDAGLGRFINRDPIGYKGGMNLYEYVGDNPLNRTDPTGLKQVCGFYVWLYTGLGWCVDESVYNAAMDAAGRVVNCFMDCEIKVHKKIPTYVCDAASGAMMLTFTHYEVVTNIHKPLAGASNLTTMQSELALALNKIQPGLGKALRLGAQQVSRYPVAAGVGSVVAGISIAEAGFAINCSIKCSQ